MTFTFDLAGSYQHTEALPGGAAKIGMTTTEWHDLWAATVTARALGSVGAISGRWRATRMESGRAVYRVTRVVPTPAPVEATVKPAVCSACGSAAPHHVEYVRQHGVCVL